MKTTKLRNDPEHTAFGTEKMKQFSNVEISPISL